MLSVYKSVDWDTMQFFRTEAGKRKEDEKRYFLEEKRLQQVLWQRKRGCADQREKKQA